MQLLLRDGFPMLARDSLGLPERTFGFPVWKKAATLAGCGLMMPFRACNLMTATARIMRIGWQRNR